MADCSCFRVGLADPGKGLTTEETSLWVPRIVADTVTAKNKEILTNHQTQRSPVLEKTPVAQLEEPSIIIENERLRRYSGVFRRSLLILSKF
jgi:hypothetical protein